MPAAAARSTFVTVVAWIFIVLGGMATFVSAMQNVMIAFMFPPDALHPIAAKPGEEDVVAIVNFVAAHMRLFFLGFFLMSALTLAASIGLLARRNWARLLFVALLVIGMIGNVAGVFLAVFFFTAITQAMPAGVAPPGGFQTFAVVAGAMNVLFVLGFLALFGWIAKRLLSPEIRREFTRAA